MSAPRFPAWRASLRPSQGDHACPRRMAASLAFRQAAIREMDLAASAACRAKIFFAATAV